MREIHLARSGLGLALLAVLGPTAPAQKATQGVRPTEQVLVAPITMSWSDLLQIQAALPEGALVHEETPGVMPDSFIEVSTRGPRVAPTAPEGGREEIGPCTGFVSEPPLGLGVASQDDVPDGGLISYIPPNTAGSVGPAHLMTMLNNKTLIQDRLGAMVSSVDTLVFWSPLAPTAVTYCRLHYDVVSDRWLATARGGTGGTMTIMFAISDTDDPTGSWDYYSTAADPGATTFPDWLTMGYNSTWVACTANMFNVVGSTGAGTRLYTFDMAAALAGGPVTVTTFASNFWQAATGTGAATSGFSLHPSRAFDNSTSALWILDNAFTSGGGVNNVMQMCSLTGTGAAPVLTPTPGSLFGGNTSLFLVVTNYSNTQRNIAQVGDARFISVFSTRLASVAIRNGRIWIAHSSGLPGPANNAAPTSNGVAVYELDPALFPNPIVQFTHNTDGVDTMSAYPSLAINCANDVLVGFSRGDVTKNPECAYRMRLGTDPLNTMGASNLLKAGDSSYWKNFGVGTTAQWGLYSSSSVDPNDDQTLWTLQEYAALRVGPADNDSRWGTWWGRLGDCETLPVITDDPDDFSGCVGDMVSFSVTATTVLPPTLMYQWRFNGNDILGATSDTYTIPVTVAADEGVYDVVVSGCGQTISLPATLEFNEPTITTQPADYVAALGEPAAFFVVATPFLGPLSYQWYHGAIPVGTNDDILAIGPVVGSDYGPYHVVVSDSCGPIASDTAMLLPPTESGKTQLAELSLHIFKHPESMLGCLGDQAVFSVEAYPDDATYEWRFNGSPIVPPETNPTLVINPVMLSHDGIYDVVVSKGPKSKTSLPASLTVIDLPVITVQPGPVSQSRPPGSTVVYSVTATGGGTVTYQWEKKPQSGGGTTQFEPIPFQVGTTLTLEDITVDDAGTYRCKITNECGFVRTRSCTLIVIP